MTGKTAQGARASAGAALPSQAKRHGRSRRAVRRPAGEPREACHEVLGVEALELLEEHAQPARAALAAGGAEGAARLEGAAHEALRTRERELLRRLPQERGEGSADSGRQGARHRATVLLSQLVQQGSQSSSQADVREERREDRLRHAAGVPEAGPVQRPSGDPRPRPHAGVRGPGPAVEAVLEKPQHRGVVAHEAGGDLMIYY